MFSLGEVDRAGFRLGFDWVSLVWIAAHVVLHLESSKGSPWLVFLEHLAFFDEFGQGANACQRELLIGGLVLLHQLYHHTPRASGI